VHFWLDINIAWLNILLHFRSDSLLRKPHRSTGAPQETAKERPFDFILVNSDIFTAASPWLDLFTFVHTQPVRLLVATLFAWIANLWNHYNVVPCTQSELPNVPLIFQGHLLTSPRFRCQRVVVDHCEVNRSLMLPLRQLSSFIVSWVCILANAYHGYTVHYKYRCIGVWYKKEVNDVFHSRCSPMRILLPSVLLRPVVAHYWCYLFIGDRIPLLASRSSTTTFNFNSKLANQSTKRRSDPFSHRYQPPALLIPLVTLWSTWCTPLSQLFG